MTVGLGGLPAVSSRWRFGWLFAAPHRIAFAAAATMLSGSGLWWALVVIARSRGADLHWALPESTAHGLLMTFGFMPLFFVGFLFTAGPRWLGVPPVAARDLVAPLSAQL
ncbi:MAG: NnrS family protein, partial [Caldimonas sp.]